MWGSRGSIGKHYRSGTGWNNGVAYLLGLLGTGIKESPPSTDEGDRGLAAGGGMEEGLFSIERGEERWTGSITGPACCSCDGSGTCLRLIVGLAGNGGGMVVMLDLRRRGSRELVGIVVQTRGGRTGSGVVTSRGIWRRSDSRRSRSTTTRCCRRGGMRNGI